MIAGVNYAALVERQGASCRICGREARDRRLAVDIDHVRWVVRGLLCFNCNSGLGKFYDNPRLLMRAADYLLTPIFGVDPL